MTHPTTVEGGAAEEGAPSPKAKQMRTFTEKGGEGQDGTSSVAHGAQANTRGVRGTGSVVVEQCIILRLSKSFFITICHNLLNR